MTAVGASRVASPSAKAPRRANRAAVREFRPRRVIPAVVASAALMAIGLIAALEIISGLLGVPARLIPYPRVLAWAQSTRWNETAVIVGAAVIAALGLLLLLIALVPGRPRYVPLHTGDPELVMGMRRRSFARALEHAATSVQGVKDAKARVRGDRVRVTATTTMHDSARLEDAAHQAVAGTINSLGPTGAPRLDVSLRRR
jgi:hypothetical protein